jgi:hypothetical protein
MIDHQDIREKCQLWKFFKLEWEGRIKTLIDMFNDFKGIYAHIRDNVEFKKILGYLVGVLNILNANHAKRQQADGFNIEALELAKIFKGTNKVTLLSFVMGKMRDEDVEFPAKLKKST